MSRVTFLGIAVLLVLAACSRPSPMPTPAIEAPPPLPTPSPTREVPTPTPVATPTPQRPPLLNRMIVRGELEYSLFPTYLPEGYSVSNVFMSGGVAVVVYGDPEERLLVAYPNTFYPENSPTMTELGLLRPDDSITEVDVKGETAYLVRGGWSEETIIQGPGIDPKDAKWDYDKSLSLNIELRVSEETTVGVVVKALGDQSGWITGSEMVRLAESLERFD